MGQILFSVVIPTHNRPEFLQRAVKGLETQIFPKDKFEVIVILSPQDLSLVWLNNYRSSLNLTFIAPKKDVWNGKNVSFKRNFGAAAGSGKWIAFLDDDCVPQPEWLSSASKYKENFSIYGIEGLTLTPPDAAKTLTWKGMQQLAVPGGYQTCNMFYRKEVFTQVSKGFDSVNFPWFLEDTDLAWTVLDAGREIIYEPESVVIHPVGPAANWRLIHEAKGTGLKAKLFLKHPKLYVQNQMKAMRWSQYIYFFLLSGTVLCMIPYFEVSMVLFGLLFGVLTVHMIKMFWGLQVTVSEIIGVAWRTVVFPFIALWSLWRESQKSKLSFSTFLKLIKP